jgi:uncharacterized protein (TIGR02996 family)
MAPDAFLRAVRESPDDDAPRLVYADWLDEHGDHDRAEFIRVQCELAGLDETDPRRDDPERRERELLERHEPRWLGELPEAVSSWSFRRGFLERLIVVARDLRPDFVLPATASSVFVTGGSERAAAWRLLTADQPARLRELELAFDWREDRTLAELAEAPLLARLRRLSLTNTPGSEIRFLSDLRHGLLPGVTELEATGEGLTVGGLAALAEPDWAGRWTGLTWRAHEPNLAGSEEVARLAGCPNLRRVHLPAWPSPPSFADWPPLTHLDAGQSADVFRIRHLTAAPFLATLRRLELTVADSSGHGDLGPALADLLGGLRRPALHLRAEMPAPELAALLRDERCRSGLAGLHVTPPARPAVLRALAEGPPWAGLTDLDLEVRHGPGAEALVELLRSPALPRLRWLSLRCGRFSDGAARAMIWSPALGSLRELSLSAGQLGSLVPSMLARWPGLARLDRLTVYAARETAALAQELAESPHLSPLTSVSLPAAARDRSQLAALRKRLGRRLRP